METWGGWLSLDRGVTDLAGYLRSRGYSLIPLTTLEQLCYAANFLTIRDATCISPDTRAIAPVIIRSLRERAKQVPGRYERLLAQAEHEYSRQVASGEFFPDNATIREYGISMTVLELTNVDRGLWWGATALTCVVSRR